LTASNIFFDCREDKTYQPTDKEFTEAENDSSEAGSDLEIIGADLGSDSEPDNKHGILKQDFKDKMGKILNK